MRGSDCEVTVITSASKPNKRYSTLALSHRVKWRIDVFDALLLHHFRGADGAPADRAEAVVKGARHPGSRKSPELMLPQSRRLSRRQDSDGAEPVPHLLVLTVDSYADSGFFDCRICDRDAHVVYPWIQFP